MFLIQAGFQSSTQIAEALPAGLCDGVIWSPGDESADSLESRMGDAGLGAAAQAIDPQLYVAMLADANPKKLGDHKLFNIPMTARQFSAQRLGETVERILDYQLRGPATHILSPTVAVSSMADRSAQIALNLAETTLQAWSEREDGRPLLISSAIEASVLSDRDNVNALLDELTSLEADGFYLLFEIDPRSDPTAQDALLAEALYIVYTLGVLSEAEVWVGYAGLTGYVFRAVGAAAFACGWFQKQQYWSTGHWLPRGGGRAPRARIYLESLLGSLLIDPELQTIRGQRGDPSLPGDLLGSGLLAESIKAGERLTPDRTACALQLFAVCQELNKRIGGSVRTDLQRVREDLNSAAALFERINDAGVELEGRSSESHLSVWRTAIDGFVGRAGISL